MRREREREEERQERVGVWCWGKGKNGEIESYQCSCRGGNSKEIKENGGEKGKREE